MFLWFWEFWIILLRLLLSIYAAAVALYQVVHHMHTYVFDYGFVRVVSSEGMAETYKERY